MHRHNHLSNEPPLTGFAWIVPTLHGACIFHSRLLPPRQNFYFHSQEASHHLILFAIPSLLRACLCVGCIPPEDTWTREGTQQGTWRYAANIRDDSGMKISTGIECGVSGVTVQN
jgi:hypothetical protein